MANEYDVQHKAQSNSVGESQLDAGNRVKPVKTSSQSDAVHNKEDSDKVKATLLNHGYGDESASVSALSDLVVGLDVGNDRISNCSNNNVGDYTNIRATTGPAGAREGFTNQTSTDSSQNSHAGGSANALNTCVQQQQAPPMQNSSLSFKHFLSNCSVLTAPSSTVTSLDPATSTSANNLVNATTTNANTATTKTLQTSTGARPKVPQPTHSATSSSIPSLNNNVNSAGSGNLSVSSNSTGTVNVMTSVSKMKRSPRFSSFDSQASLTEYTESNAPARTMAVGVTSSSTDYHLNSREREYNGYETWNLPLNSITAPNMGSGERGQYVPRSYSNYDVPGLQTSPCRRHIGAGERIKENRPTRLSLNTNSNTTAGGGGGGASAKMKLDLPLNKCSAASSNAIHRIKDANSTRSTDFQYRMKMANPNRSTDYQTNAPPPPGAASALPDFVQDHWMDSWYSYDMQLNSSPTSPVDEFFDNIKGPGNAPSDADVMVNRTPSMNLENQQVGTSDTSAPARNSAGSLNMGLQETNSAPVGSKMLPDFLSDGPIIHSSQRLADVATGLPSNTVGSPQESTITTQLSRMRSENERLHRELSEARTALNEQTRRANDLQRQLIECQKEHQEKVAHKNLTTQMTKNNKNEEMLEEKKNKRLMFTMRDQDIKLKQQVLKLTAEVETLRREKELLREEGAVGGCTLSSCDRPTAVTTTITSGSSRSNNGENTAGSVNSIRPSRSRHLARELLSAAANAESNLRQLLAGVDNLRQMAADIEHSNLEVGTNPDLFSDFLNECDDEYEEYPGKSTL